MKRVLLESPYAGDVDRNVKYLKECLRDSLSRGEAPFASHAIYPLVLDDEDEEERRQGIDAGLAWKEVAEGHIFYIDFGISRGMQYAIDYATDNNIKIEFRKIYDL